jgi:hypothetical protein
MSGFENFAPEPDTSGYDGHERNDMKEVFTKSFWEGVKKTFHEAQQDPPLADNASQTPADGDQSASSTSETTSPPSVSSEGH